MDRKKTDLHGGNIYKVFRERDIKEILDYSSNINPYGIPESLKQAIGENLNILERYPDPDYIQLRSKIAFENKVDISDVILGNGATEIIFLYMRAVKPKKIIIVSPTFAEYERAVRAVQENREDGLQIDYFPLREEEGFNVNVENLISGLERGYDLLIMCNPNNPTGKFLPLTEMERIIGKCNEKETKLFVDEAFIEFVEGGTKKSVVNAKVNKKNLFVVRAFTKFFAIPGLRLGYGICLDEDITFAMDEKKEPWSVNNIAELAGITVLDDSEYIERTERWIKEEKEYVYKKLQSIDGIKPYKTEVNFILVKIEDNMVKRGINAGKLKEVMLEKGILIRDASNFKYLDESYFRLAIKGRKDNNKIIDTLGECLNGMI